MLVKPEPPEATMLPADGTDLDEVIGELQSTWGVPLYPQEYRITIKVADKERSSSGNGSGGPPAEQRSDQPKREKAPSPARLAAGEETGPEREKAPRRRRRGRRRGRGGGSKGPSGTAGS